MLYFWDQGVWGFAQCSGGAGWAGGLHVGCGARRGPGTGAAYTVGAGACYTPHSIQYADVRAPHRQ